MIKKLSKMYRIDPQIIVGAIHDIILDRKLTEIRATFDTTSTENLEMLLQEHGESLKKPQPPPTHVLGVKLTGEPSVDKRRYNNRHTTSSEINS